MYVRMSVYVSYVRVYVCFSLFVLFGFCVFVFNFVAMFINFTISDQLDEPICSSGSPPFHC